jgi:hypothetical protein
MHCLCVKKDFFPFKCDPKYFEYREAINLGSKGNTRFL